MSDIVALAALSNWGSRCDFAMPLTILSTPSTADDALDFPFVRSSGSGGRNVDEATTEVGPRWNPTSVPGQTTLEARRVQVAMASSLLGGA